MHTKLRPSSYEEFQASFALDVPERYNFAFDMVDAAAAENPDRLAMVHVDDADVRREYTFGYFSEQSSRLANALKGLGIGRGDKVMIILHRRVEFWTVMLALHKLGALGVPSPALLTAKDITYRVNFASIKGAIVDTSVRATVEAANPDCPTLTTLVLAGLDQAEGPWQSFSEVVAGASPNFPRPADAACGEDPATIFFSSGTTGHPKMVLHNFNYPFGHVMTGSYWHDIEPGNLHLTVADTGWAKSV